MAATTIRLLTDASNGYRKLVGNNWAFTDTSIQITGSVATNIGSNHGIFKNKVNDTLEFLSLKAGNNVTLSSNESVIEISASGSGIGPSDVTNIGNGDGLFSDNVGGILTFRSLVSGSFINIVADSDILLINGEKDGASGGTVVIDSSQTTAFDEILVSQNTPLVQMNFTYGYNGKALRPTLTGSGTLYGDTALALLHMQTGTTTNSSAKYVTFDVLQYRAGQSIEVRMCPIFDYTPTASTVAICGVGDNVDGFFFGYNGTNFGALHRNNSVDTWYAQSAWNVDTFDGNGPSGITLDTSKGNVYRIQYQGIEYGNIYFSIENPITGKYVQVHSINYANSHTTPSLSLPYLPLGMQLSNGPTTTNVKVNIASHSGFLQGSNELIGTRYCCETSKTISGGTETPIISILNGLTFQNKKNRIEIYPDYVSFATDGTKNVKFRTYVNATLTGATYINSPDAYSVVTYDTNSSALAAAGRLYLCFNVTKSGSETYKFTDMKRAIPPGVTLTVTAISQATSNIDIAVGWIEDQ